jgi:hypothetical protein
MNIVQYKEGSIQVDIPFDENIYINATEVYQAFGKSQTSFSNWKTRTLIPYAERLIETTKVTSQNVVSQLSDLIIVRKGNTNQFEQGTWLHPKLAIIFARWLSMDFEIWCDEKISELLRTRKVEITVDEQSVVLDKVSAVMKGLKEFTNWGMILARAIREINNTPGVDKIESQKQLVSKVCRKVSTEERLPLLQRMERIYGSLLTDRSITEDMYKTMMLHLARHIKHTLYRRLTGVEKDKSATIDSLTEKVTQLIREKDEATPTVRRWRPLTPGKTDLETPQGIDKALNLLKTYSDKEITIIAAEYLSSYPAEIGKNGKPKPEFKTNPNTFNKVQCAVWRNSNSYFLMYGENTQQKSMMLYEDGDLYHYTEKINIGHINYHLFNPNNGYIIIYQHNPQE